MTDLNRIEFDEEDKANQGFLSTKVGDIEYQRESLAIVTSLGTTKECLGVEMNIGKIHKLSEKDVEKFFNKYQAVAGQKMTSGLVDSAIKTASKTVSYVAPIDDPDELCSHLQKDELVKRELSNFAGLLVVRGGRFVTLASALFQIVRHIKFDTKNLDEYQKPEGRRESVPEGFDEHTPPPHLREPSNS